MQKWVKKGKFGVKMVQQDYIWDPLRKKSVRNTPEEAVRQWFISVLHEGMHIPEHMMGSEVALSHAGKESPDGFRGKSFPGVFFRNMVADDDRPLITRFHTTWIKVGPVEDEFFDSFGIFQGEGEGDVAAVRETEKDGLIDTFFVHKVVQIFSKLLNSERLISFWRFAMAACINGNDAILF